MYNLCCFVALYALLHIFYPGGRVVASFACGGGDGGGGGADQVLLVQPTCPTLPRLPQLPPHLPSTITLA